VSQLHKAFSLAGRSSCRATLQMYSSFFLFSAGEEESERTKAHHCCQQRNDLWTKVRIEPDHYAG
jgi:hypothetical protein